MPMGEEIKHESMGMVGMSRVSCTGVAMHGSDVLHSGYIALRIQTARIDRRLSKDWHHADREIVEVHLTHAQFAEMISNMNCGDGVPCTLNTVMGKRMENPRPLDRKKQFRKDFNDDISEIGTKLYKVQDMLEKLHEKTGATKKEKEEILGLVKMANQGIESNLLFVRDSFEKCLDEGIEDAKRNIEGHALNAALNAAKRNLVTNKESEQLVDLGGSTVLLSED